MMNWYHKFLKLAHRNPIEKDSIAITQEIFQKIKQSYLNRNNTMESQTLQYKPAPNLGNLNTETLTDDQMAIRDKLVFNINIHKTTNINEVQVGGMSFGNSIEIDINIPNNFSNQSFESLYSWLFETIRHEIKHFINYLHGKSFQRFPKERSLRTLENIQRASHYILSKTELMPFINGILLRAKRWRIPFEQATLQTIDKILRSFDENYSKQNPPISPNDLQEIQNIRQHILNTIIEKASAIYPVPQGYYNETN